MTALGVATSAFALAAALLASLALTSLLLRQARRRGWGKSVRLEGPEDHLAKEGTPTMGGLAFLAAALPIGVAAALVAGRGGADAVAIAALTAAAGAIGLYDDRLSLARARRAAAGEDASTGLLARYRLLGQGLVGLAFGAYATANGISALPGPSWIDAVFFALVISGSINALNFSDGLDGLAGGMAAIMLLLFVGSPLAAALIGALLGFLAFNAHPARLFMGGVGSEALGAAIAGFAILDGAVWWLPLLAIVPVAEVVSVILQVTWFRLSGGRRLFKMSPLHHHVELSGVGEVHVVIRFWIATALACALTWGLRAVVEGRVGGPL